VERLKCAKCDSRVGAREIVCRNCGAPLLDEGAVRSEPVPEQPVAAEPAVGEPAVTGPAPAAAGRCPHCAAEVRDPHSLVCLQCLGELRPGVPAAGPRLTLRFRWGTGQADASGVDVQAGEELVLGREVPNTRVPALGAFDNVSRTHATVGISANGTAWVRDEGSTNGTFVDGRRVPASTVVALRDGAELRLASNIRAAVQIGGHVDVPG
jgi:hypothetical protein